MVVSAAGAGDAVVVLAVSLAGSALLGSAAGAVTTSEGLVSGAFSVVFAVSGTDAVESSLKSLIVGGGTFAGSGRGIAASIASSAALLRAGSDWANAEVADTVRKVAAKAISTRSNPARFFKRSRIVTPLGRNCSGMEQFSVSSAALAKAPALSVLKRHSVNVCTQRLFLV